MGNVATGLVAGLNLARYAAGEPLWDPPITTMVGALCHYVTHAEPKHFQPMKANFGILPMLSPRPQNKRERYVAYAERALRDLGESLNRLADPFLTPSHK